MDMNSPMKLKAALARDNFPDIKVGRGRPSKAMVERAKHLAAFGNDEFPGPWNIEGYSVSKPVIAVDKPAAAPVVTKVTTSAAKVVLDVPDFRYSDNDVAVYASDGVVVPVGIRGVCNTCNGSFTHHVCDNPTAWRDQENVAVRIIVKGEK